MSAQQQWMQSHLQLMSAYYQRLSGMYGAHAHSGMPAMGMPGAMGYPGFPASIAGAPGFGPGMGMGMGMGMSMGVPGSCGLGAHPYLQPGLTPYAGLNPYAYGGLAPYRPHF